MSRIMVPRKACCQSIWCSQVRLVSVHSLFCSLCSCVVCIVVEGVYGGTMGAGTFMSGEKRKTAIGYDARMLNHEETGKVHPERPDRLKAIMGGLQASDFCQGVAISSPRERLPKPSYNWCTQRVM